MPAPRCPPIHKQASDWEKWIETYLVYYNRAFFPATLRSFNEYKKCPHIPGVHVLKTERAWKYLAYFELTGRKHRTLTI